ncbi:MAG TPA: amino acid adenylation domain-containing protein, partial [Blastocatellia bacterium]|nr:amino acid adenylation domain-containing protein [Blastocatellia bacterium]
QKIRREDALFETVFNYIQFHVYELMDRQDIELLGKQSFEEMNLPFVAYFSPVEPGISLGITYHTSEFTKEQIQAIGCYYLNALTAIAIRPEGRYEVCSLLPIQEQQLLLSSPTASSERACVHELFLEVARRKPESAAVIFEDSTLTYGELNRESNTLAVLLRRSGAGPGVPVGICLERSLNTIVAVLATLRAGGICLPLDPAYPRQRLAFILRDAGVEVLLTQRRLLGTLPEIGAEVICLEQSRPLLENTNEAGVSGVDSDQLFFDSGPPGAPAYVIYTSGSTGNPKGVVQTHDCLSNLVGWHLASTAEPRRTLQFASLNFDVSFQEIFSTLCQGGQLLLVSESDRVDMAVLGRRIAENRIQRFHIPNAVLEQLAEEFAENTEPIASLTELMVGGEKLQITGTVAKLFSRLGHCTLYNHYGPSETHVITSYPLPSDLSRWPVIPPIGSRIVNSRTSILDSSMMPAPIAVQGELYLGGAGLAQGYLNRSELTADRFLPDPYSPEPGARFYKTGDLARLLPDGNIEFIGRNDYQIKIRGNRVELSEVEVALHQYPGVREAVAAVLEDTPGNKRILAYLAPRVKGELDIHRLAADLREKLPGYMVPSTFVLIDSLPRTLSGKVDRRALPRPMEAPAETVLSYSLPRNPIEEVLGKIWCEVLGVKAVGIDDDFFNLGGHSLLATQVISRVRKVFAIDIPLRTVFDSKTLADFARTVGGILRGDHRNATFPIDRAPAGADLLPSFAQERMWLLDRLDPASFAYILPFSIRLAGRLDVAALEQSLSEIVRRHEVLRTGFSIIADRPVQVARLASNLALDEVDLTGMSGAASENQMLLLADADSRRSFDLSRPPLFRAKLLRMGTEEHALVITIHHIVFDGWSLGLLVQELDALYRLWSSGGPSLFPELPVQYADYAYWQRRLLQGEFLDTQLSYWREYLKDTPAGLELPADYPRPSVQTFQGGREYVILPDTLVEGVRALNRREGVTLFMTLLTAFEVLLYRHSGQRDFCIGTPIANRSTAEIEGLIGLFVNTLVLRAGIDSYATFLSVMETVRHATLGAYAHQDAPFELLVDELKAQRDLSRSPLFQVMIVLNNAPMGELQLEGVKLSPVELETHASKFDLTLTAVEAGHELHCSLEYNRGLFEEPTIKRLLSHFRELLGAAIRTPRAFVSGLPMLTTAEAHQALSEWNDTRAAFEQLCIHELIEAQADQRPDAIAVIFEDSQLSYGELNHTAGQVAGYLRALGLKEGSLAGICVERSLDMIVGLLGILKTGAGYVPFDPGHPVERLAFMIEDSHVALLLTREEHSANLPANGPGVVCLDRYWQDITASNGGYRTCHAGPDSLCYVIYTSGSTGTPKAAMNTHRGVVNRLQWMQSHSPLDPADSVLHKTPITFDVSAAELFSPLIAGARVVVATAGGHRDSRYLAQLV